jgi:hypothetical protein
VEIKQPCPGFNLPPVLATQLQVKRTKGEFEKGFPIGDLPFFVLLTYGVKMSTRKNAKINEDEFWGRRAAWLSLAGVG